MRRLLARTYLRFVFALVVALALGAPLISIWMRSRFSLSIDPLLPGAIAQWKRDHLARGGAIEPTPDLVAEREDGFRAFRRPPRSLDARDRARLERGEIVLVNVGVLRDAWARIESGSAPAFYVRYGPLYRSTPDPWGALFIALVLLAAIAFALRPLRRDVGALVARIESLDPRRPDALEPLSESARRGPLGPASLAFERAARALASALNESELVVDVVTHELRTPLARLFFGLEASRAHAGGELALELDRAMDAALEFQEVIDEVIAYHELRAGTGLEPRSSLDLGAWLARWVERAGARVTLELDSAADGARVVVAPALLARALRNVIENAERAARARVIVRVAARDRLLVHVDDDGTGFPASWLGPLELDEAPWRDPERAPLGLGLGLVIASRVAALHGAALVLGVSPEGGARVTIGLSLAS